MTFQDILTAPIPTDVKLYIKHHKGDLHKVVPCKYATGLSVSLVQDLAEKALVTKLDSYIIDI